MQTNTHTTYFFSYDPPYSRGNNSHEEYRSYWVVWPPVTNTCPDDNKVAVCSWRAINKLGSTIHVSDEDIYASQLE